MKLKDKAIITAAVTGAVHIPSISEYLPITPQQIIDQAVGAAEARRGSRSYSRTQKGRRYADR